MQVLCAQRVFASGHLHAAQQNLNSPGAGLCSLSSKGTSPVQVYNQCSMLAREMAKISASDLLPNAGGVGSVLKSFLPSFSFKSLPFVGRIFGRGGGGGGGGGGSS